MEKPVFHPKGVREFFFWTGITATIAYRIIVILNHINGTLSLVAWYIGTVGFILYFAHRYQISEKRARLIRERNLLERIKTVPDLTQDERDVMHYLFTGLLSTKEKWNYICIFVISGVALVFSLYLDFIAPLLRP